MMQASRVVGAGVAAFLLAMFSVCGAANARQISSGSQSGFPSQTTPDTRNPHILNPDKAPEDAAQQRFEEEAAKARNSDRFKRIQSDTDKLLKLSTELKADVDKSTKNEMSLDVIRKAAEVEKLAHDVKERMKS